MDITIIGTGYVGLCQAVAFSDIGHNVVCVDVAKNKIDMLNNFIEEKSDKLPIFEKGLPELIKKNSARLKFTDNLIEGINSDAIFICVGTPSNENGEADLGALKNVCISIGKNLSLSNKEHALIVTKSTVPIGTHKLVKNIIKQYTNRDFSVVSNPEFLAQGRAMKDSIQPSRIVIGKDNGFAKDTMYKIYKPYEDKGIKLFFMGNTDAELHKYAANAYLATQVSLTNNLANLARAAGADWNKVKKAILEDKRVGRFVNASSGFGGSCFGKDVRELIHSFGRFNVDNSLLKEVINQNIKQKEHFIPRIEKYLSGLEDKRICILGLAFKAGTNDIRGSAAMPIIKGLISSGARINAYDPEAIEETKKELQNFEGKEKITYYNSKEEALEDCDVVLILTEWPEFLEPDFELIKSKLKKAAIFDGRDLFDLKKIESFGFDYFSIGRPDLTK
ncbi:MAG: UDP-glucose/GDP-mannose dehydrogenase family protein [Nanoarchaeota archaeon]|nr:UDP-glucose/GDP-mannose dehydrogenase family protein [Nanoarchaeota archaeon]